MNEYGTVTVTTQQQRARRMERYARWIIFIVFYYARFLDVFSCQWDSKQKRMLPVNKCLKRCTSLFRVLIVIVYWDVIPQLLKDFFHNPRSFMQWFSVLQVFSVAIFSSGLFVMKILDEFKLIQMINRFLQLNRQIADLMRVEFSLLLSKKFIVLILLKMGITVFGFINELPNILNVDAYHLNGWVSTTIGVYLWLGSMVVLDACYMGFLMMGAMYCNVGLHLQTMLVSMKNVEAGSHLGASLTSYHRMKLLCDYSEKLDDIGMIYARLYRLTKDFVHIFQWNILYYIYYNFMVIFLLLNHCIWQYIQGGFVDFVEIFFVFVKIANLVLIIMCANDTVEKSEMPNQMNLDVICSDIDIRWDTSVENFLSQRKVENLDIRVFGLFSLNNEFILLMLSAIITYLFFIIQFGMSGGFGTSGGAQT